MNIILAILLIPSAGIGLWACLMMADWIIHGCPDRFSDDT